MNSIATPNRISTQSFQQERVAVTARGWIAAIVLALIWISFQPFEGAHESARDSSIVNQIGYTSLCLVTLIMLFTTVDRRVFNALVSPAWLVLFAALAMPLLFSNDVEDASEKTRAVLFSLFAVILAANFITMPRNADELSKIFLWVCGLVLFVNYAGLFLLPLDAIHQANETESHHQGLWRGLYSHKNIAGPVMVSIGFVGVYLMRRGKLVAGAIIAIAAWVFIANTGSKTSTIVAPIVVLMILLPSMMGLRFLAAIAALAAMFATHALTVGTVFSPALDAILRSVTPDITFTGRVEIWDFAKTYLYENFWTGFGYDGFWRSETVMLGELSFDSVWDPRGIVHGHHGYLDFALIAGVPMTLLLIWVTILAPAIDYLRTPLRKENVLLADLMFMIVSFAVMNAALESFFFRRADPVWLTLVVALFGLRLAARLPILSR